MNSNNCYTTPQYVTLPPVTENDTASVETANYLPASNIYTNAGTKTASFTGLMPNETYAVYEMRARYTEDDLTPNNLLYINQTVADVSGNLTMQYTPIISVEDSIVFAVGANSIELSESNMEITVPNLTYTGEQQGANVTITYRGKLLTEGVDYEISGDWFATEIGSYAITITGTGIYTGSVEKTYQIVEGEEKPERPSEPESASEAEKPSEPESASEPEKPSEPERPSEPESASATESTGETESTSETESTNESENLVNPENPTQITDNDAKLEIYIPSQYFNNKAQTVKPNILYDNERLTQGIDYTVEYLDDQRSVGLHTLKLTFIGDYTGEVTRSYTIYQKKAENVTDISKLKFKLNPDEVKNAYYTGSAVRPTVIAPDSALKENVDYKVIYKNNYHEGKATVTILGLDNPSTGKAYVGTKVLTFKIKKVNIKNSVRANAYESTYDYMGEPVMLEDLMLTCGSYTLKQGTDYTISYSKNRTSGTATATVKGMGDFTGSMKCLFTIKPVSLADIPDNAVAGIPYSPKGAKLKRVKFGSVTLQEGVDYTAKYTYSDKKNKAVGTFVTIELKGKNACNKTTKTFENMPIAAADFSNCVVKDSVPSLIVDADKMNKREVKVTDDAGTVLKENKDYALTWDTKEKNDGAMYTLTITPLDTVNYTGTKTVSYRIAKNLGKQKEIAVKDKIYNGRNAVQLRASDIIGLDAADYDIISYKNNIKVGTAQVTIQGKGRYYGTKTLRFKITD